MSKIETHNDGIAFVKSDPLLDFVLPSDFDIRISDLRPRRVFKLASPGCRGVS